MNEWNIFYERVEILRCEIAESDGLCKSYVLGDVFSIILRLSQDGGL